MATTFPKDEVYARSAAADVELQAPQKALSITQRRMLALLEQPRSFAAIAASMHADEARVERDLARLIELGLVRRIVHGKDAPAAPSRAAPPTVRAALPMARPAPPARSAARRAAVALIGLGTIGVAVAIAWSMRERTGSDDASRVSAEVAAVSTPITPMTPIVAAPTAAPQSTASLTTASFSATPDAAPRTTSLTATPDPRPPAHASEPVHGTHASEASAAKRSEPVVPPSAAHPEPSPASLARSKDAPASASAPAPPPAAAQVRRIEAPAAAMVPASPPEASARPPAQPAEAAVPASVARPATEPTQPTLVATAPPSMLAPPPRPKLAPIVREEPEFPREALLSNITTGRVVARLTIDRDGHVASVDIVSAEPRRVFDRSVNRALSRWRFEPSSESRTTEVEVDFKAN